MPTLEFFLVADSVSTDRERNTLSVFHILEEWPARLPLVIPQLVVVSSWRMATEDLGRDFQVALDIQLPGKQQSPDLQILPVNFTAEHARHRTYHFVRGLRIEEAGDVLFDLRINGQHAGTFVLWVREKDGDE